MYKKFLPHPIKSITAFLLVIFLVFQGFFLFTSQPVNAQVTSKGDFVLNAINQGINPEDPNYIKLSWDSVGNGYDYVISQSTDDGVTFETRSSNYGKPIKVLNVYPATKDTMTERPLPNTTTDTTKNGDFLKEWMETGGVNGAGKGLISVDSVWYKDFQNNADKYLKKDNVNYDYDVVMFGSSDSNNSNGDLSSSDLTALKNYIKTGRGLLFGHDVSVSNYTDDPKNPGWPLRIGTFGRENLGMSKELYTESAGKLQKVYGTEIKVVNDGFLLQYPWTLSKDNIYTVPMSHSTFQHSFLQADTNETRNTIWMQYNNPSKNSGLKLGEPLAPMTWSDNSTDNFYLATFNNTAMIQTGHLTGKSTIDEQHILANTLMYLAQHTNITMADDRSAIDLKAPELTSVVRKNDKNISIIGKDFGTNYTYKVVATPLTSGTSKTSNIVSEESKSMLKGYYILEDTNPYGVPKIERDPITNAITTPVTLTAHDDINLTYEVKNINNYIHVQAVDYAGNLSPVKTIDSIKLDVTLATNESKVYKSGWASMTSTINAGVGIQDLTVQYIMVPVSDATDYGTESAFVSKLNSIGTSSDNAGSMNNFSNSNQYNMYSTSDNTLNGIKNNCNIWVMAKGSINDSIVTAFATHTFINIYTPIDIYHKGETTSGSALYADTRIGEYENTYGIPLDLDGENLSVLPSMGYDEVLVTPKDFSPLYLCLNSQESLILKDIASKDKLYTFTYSKNTDNWSDTTFHFKDQNGNNLNSDLYNTNSETIVDFTPNNADKDFYTPYNPPEISGYKPIGYILGNDYFNATDVIPVSFPGGFGDVTLNVDDVTIVYISTISIVTVTEQYHLFVGDDDKGNPPLREDSITTLTQNGNFSNANIPIILGYVYTGYTITKGTNINEYASADKTETGAAQLPYATKPTINSVDTDTEIIYHYKIDKTNTGIPDELQRKITIKGIGIDSRGIPTDLYTKVSTEIIGNTYEPKPLGEPDNFGNPTVFEDNSQYFLLADSGLNDLTSFTVTEDKTLVFYYYKDSGPSGVADFFEANVKVEFVDESNNPIAVSFVETKLTSKEGYFFETPHIFGYAAIKAIIKNEKNSAISESKNIPVVGNIELLGNDSWTIKFVYGIDLNNDGISDGLESEINILCTFNYKNGFIEETLPAKLYGQDSQTVVVDPAIYNKPGGLFDYVGNSAPISCTFSSDASPMEIHLTYNENNLTSPPINIDNGNNNGINNGNSNVGNNGSINVINNTENNNLNNDVSNNLNNDDNTVSNNLNNDDNAVSNNLNNVNSNINNNADKNDNSNNNTEAESREIDAQKPKTETFKYLQTVDTKFAIVGVKYLTEIADNKVPEGYSKIKKIDDKGVEYWELIEDNMPLSDIRSAEIKKENPQTGDLSLYLTTNIILSLILIFVVTLLFFARRFVIKYNNYVK